MAKKTKTKASALTCGECIHEYACAMWNTGTITRASAEHCTEYTTCRESAAYLVGRLECGAWWDNLSDDISDADLNPLDDAITTLRGTFDRLTYCSECRHFKQKSSTFGDCERNNCRRTVFDFCSNGDADKELENPYEIKITVREALETLNASKALLKQFREAEANIDEQIKQLEEFGANHCMDTIVKTVRLDEVCCCPEKENEE